jgi:hypothetical protein
VLQDGNATRQPLIEKSIDIIPGGARAQLQFKVRIVFFRRRHRLVSTGANGAQVGDKIVVGKIRVVIGTETSAIWQSACTALGVKYAGRHCHAFILNMSAIDQRTSACIRERQ